MRVAAALADDDLRVEGPHHRRHDGVEGTQPASVVGAGGQRDVHRTAFGACAAHLRRVARAREQRERGLVQADGQHPRVVPEHRLDAVAVVDVEVQVGHPLGPQPQQPDDRHRGVVVHAEAAGAVGHRVVQAAGDVDGVQRVAPPHCLGGPHTAADDQRGRLVHALEHRVVGSVEAPSAEVRVRRRLADRIEVGRVVDQPQQRVVGRFGSHHRDVVPVEHAERAGQLDGQLHPDGIERVVTEVVGEEARVPHHGRRRRGGGGADRRLDFDVGRHVPHLTTGPHPRARTGAPSPRGDRPGGRLGAQHRPPKTVPRPG